MIKKEKCPNCKGRGLVAIDWGNCKGLQTCPICLGTGKYKEKKVEK